MGNQRRSRQTLLNLIMIFPIFGYAVAWGTQAWYSDLYLPEFLSILFISFCGLFLYRFVQTRNRWALFGLALFSIALQIAVPIQNLQLGDGIHLLENVYVESKLFGFQRTMDELLEAFLHSKVFLLTGGVDPLFSYRIWGNIAGVAFVLLVSVYSRKFQWSFISVSLILTAGGMMLFHGYPENYTIVTLLISVYCFICMDWIRKENKGKIYLIAVTLLACVSILTHLVSGYLIFSLIYLCYLMSPRGQFWQNALLCTLIGFFILGSVFAYFLFFADPTFSTDQTHLLHPPIYPWKRWISMNHLKEILSCLLFACPLGFTVFVYVQFIPAEAKQRFFAQKEIRFLLFVVLGFFVHAFFHNPQLGFPRDWDLMSFYWFPISLFSAMYLSKEESKTTNWTGFSLVFCALLYFSQIAHYRGNSQQIMTDYRNTLRIAESFTDKRKNYYDGMNSKNKKFFLQIDFFLYKTRNILLEYKDLSKAKMLISINSEFQNELENHFYQMQPKPQRQEFLARLTRFHEKYLELIEKIR